ncbi:C-C motif chemokine 19b [Hypomesus transpacificus]|uniref:C-C motif chemokine 19b n=1 Tax=Hypomesus transpacificus TaxID=137520 RepID=UPI001F07F9D5|nr:C-C motif chemokine 19b [Hypomesus transpacificus]
MSFRVAALLLLTVQLWSHVSANTDKAVDCCLSTTNRKIPPDVVQSYFIQSVSGGCRIPATVFVTRKNIRLCAPPASRNNWVARLIRKLKPQTNQKGPTKTRRNKKGKRKGERRA